MEERKWEELNMDCLANIFGRVGMESLILDVPFVCKSWYKATLNPLCWQHFVFPKISLGPWYYDPFTSRITDEYQVKRPFSVNAFMKFLVNRSHGSATKIVLPNCCTEEALVNVADKCPALKILGLPDELPKDCVFKIPSLISKWRNLEQLILGSNFNMREIIAQISIHCNNFVGLHVGFWADIGVDEASAIVTLLPNIKYLYLRKVFIKCDVLVMILQGCKQLVYLDVSESIGFEEDDEEVLKLASHITTFKCEGCSRWDYNKWYDWDDHYSDTKHEWDDWDYYVDTIYDLDILRVG